jgi:hypothetical protein
MENVVVARSAKVPFIIGIRIRLGKSSIEHVS